MSSTVVLCSPKEKVLYVRHMPGTDGDLLTEETGLRSDGSRIPFHKRDALLSRFPFDFPVDKQKCLCVNIRSAMEVMRVKTKPMPVVRCEYAQAEKSLAQLLEESFRLYLSRILATQAPAAVQPSR